MLSSNHRIIESNGQFWGATLYHRDAGFNQNGKLALRQGGDGKTDFALALRSDPSLDEARLYLSRLQTQPQRRVSWLRWLCLGLLAGGLLLLGLWRRQSASIK